MTILKIVMTLMTGLMMRFRDEFGVLDVIDVLKETSRDISEPGVGVSVGA